MTFFKIVFSVFIVNLFFAHNYAQNKDFEHNIKTQNKPWTNKEFKNNPDNFQFAIVSDRTGGHREGVFAKAMEHLNLIQPEFVMSVGDLIEGYTRDVPNIYEQWTEFDSIISPLEMKFFALPGNHDVFSSVSRDIWEDRYGKAYYHFKYKDVLFLAMDTNDADKDGRISPEQIDYFLEVLNKNKDVRWTMIFMHHPLWLYEDNKEFLRFEEALKGRKYSVFAGHTHTYLYSQRNKRNYYVLSTTGGGSAMRGVSFGEFDHVTWLTMTNEGPKMINLAFDGLVSHDVVDSLAYKKKEALVKASKFNAVMTKNKRSTAGKVHFNVTNTSVDTLYFDGRIFHNHHLDISNSKMKFRIPPNSTEGVSLDWKLNNQKIGFEKIDPVEIDFSIGYKTDKFDPKFQLSGVYKIPKTIDKEFITFTSPDVFMNKKTVAMQCALQGIEIRYTLDGSVPTKASKIYDRPFELNKTTTIQARLFSDNSDFETSSISKKYTQQKPLKPILKKFKKQGLTYEYYEGNFEDVPVFNKLKPIDSGIVNVIDVEAVAESNNNRLDHFAIRYSGYVNVPEDGLYTFYTKSDDGSNLYIDDKWVVNNSGSHSTRTREGYIALKKGFHGIRVEYFEDYMGEELKVYWKLPESQRKVEIPITNYFIK